MLIASRKASLLLSGLLVTSAVMAASGGHPEGFWILANTAPDMPFGGLRLNKIDHFELLVYDNEYKLYSLEGPIKQKNNISWELKDSMDYSNTFLMTRDRNKIILVDTENQKMFFFETTQSKLEKEIKQHSNKSPNRKVNK